MFKVNSFIKNKNNRGFTLIELLVVIAIIGLLATIVMVSLNTARAKSRDAKRQADLKQIVTAMALYYDDNQAYPTQAADACSTAISGCSGTYPTAIGTYANAMPLDPSNDSTHYYRFKHNADTETFCVVAVNLENTSASFYASNKGLGFGAAGAVTCPNWP